LSRLSSSFSLFFLTAPAPPDIYTLSLHDALPISRRQGHGRRQRALQAPRHRRDAGPRRRPARGARGAGEGRHVREARRRGRDPRSEEHTSELQSRSDLVCRLLLEKKKKSKIDKTT